MTARTTSHDVKLADCSPPTGTYQWHLPDGELKWTPGLVQLYGRELPMDGENSFLDCVHPEDRVRVEAETSAFMEQGATYSHIFRIIRSDGTVRTVLDRGVIRRAADGSPIAFDGMNIDLTDDLVGLGLRPDQPGSGIVQSADRAVEAAGLGYYGLNLENRQSYWSRELLHLIGRPHAGETPTMDLALQFVHPDDRYRVRAEMDRVSEAPTSFDMEYRIFTPDGSCRWVRDRGESSLSALDGRPIRVFGVLSDVTDRKALEVELRQAVGLLEAIFENAPLGLAAFDREFRFLRVNRTLADINGIPAAAHIGKRPDEVLPGLGSLDVIYDAWRAILAGGPPILDHEVVGHTEASEQARIWNEHFFPIQEGETIAGIAGIIEDVTERRAAEAIRRESFDRLRKVLDSTSAMVGVLTPDGTMVEVNDVALRAGGLTRDEVIGAKFWDAYWWNSDPATVEQLKASVARAAAGENVRYDVEVRLANDTRMTIDFLLAPVFGSAGSVEYLVPSGYDVTERNKAIAQAQLLMQEVNHRSKNILTLVLSIARQTARSDPRGFLDKFSERLSSLARVQDLLVKGNWESFDLQELFQSQLRHLKDDVGSRILMNGPRVTVNADAAQNLSMVIYELSTNALKYGALSRTTGQVQVRWHVNPGPEGPLLSIDWVESGGPDVRTPTRRGFGHTLMHSMIEATCKARVESHFDPHGFRWHLCDGRNCVVEFSPTRL